MANELPRYQYKPLEANEFRYLEIIPDEPSKAISLRLHHESIKFGLLYQAVSYSWGTEEHNVPVEIDGAYLFITSHLQAALQMLRLHGSMKLWIDAICP